MVGRQVILTASWTAVLYVVLYFCLQSGHSNSKLNCGAVHGAVFWPADRSF